MFLSGVNYTLLELIWDLMESLLITGGMYLTEQMWMMTCLRNLLSFSIKIIGMETCLQNQHFCAMMFGILIVLFDVGKLIK